MALVTIARSLITIVNLNDGKKGDKGEAALTLVVTPNTFVFETDDKGAVLVGNKRATIALYEGTQRVTPDNVTLKMDGCNAEVVNKAILNFKTINPNTYSGYVQVTAIYKGEERTAIAEFYVSKQRWNDAEFTTIKGKFESIQEEFERVDGEITDTKSTINQLPEKITFEVLRHENGINLLKGASLLYPTITIDGKEHNILAGATIEQGALSHNGKPYLQVNKSQYTSNEYDGARFVAKVKANKTYTLSMYYRVVRSADQGFHLAPELKDKYNGTTKTYYHNNQTILQNNQWQKYENTFTTNQDGYLHFNPSVIRNGWIVFSEIQLEEGNKATPWTNPDKEERFRRAGIDIDLQRIVVTTNNFYIKNSEGQVTTAVDKDGNLIAGAIQTKETGNGHIIMRNNTQEFYKPGATYPSRIIGYIGNDWVDRRLDKDGSIIWELSENGIVYFRRPPKWEKLYERYLDTVPNLGAFFKKNTRGTIDLIFGEKKSTPASLYGWYAARDARGVITSSRGVTYEEAVQNNGKVFDVSGRFPVFNFLRPFTGIVRSATVEFYHQLQSVDGSFVPPEYTNVRNKFSLGEFYNVQFTGNNNVWYTYVTVYENGSLIDSYRIFKN